MDRQGRFIDGFGPLPESVPDSLPALQEHVRNSAAKNEAIYPIGGATQLHIGFPPAKPGSAVSLHRINKVLDYPARDMTITVQAGIRIAELQAVLAKEGQSLPVDVPAPDVATLGGAIAVNTSGSRRLGMGTLRDYVIGITVLNDRGELTKAGGRVVKNVAGYDLCKLHTGALGTLGVIVQATLKVKPIPEEKALVAIGLESSHLDKALDLVSRSQTRPVCVDVLNRPAVKHLAREDRLVFPDADWLLLIGFEENREAVTWQVGQVLKELAEFTPGGVVTHVGSASRPYWDGLAELPVVAEASLSLKGACAPSALAVVHGGPLQTEGALLHVHAMTGVFRAHFLEPQSKEGLRGRLESLQHMLGPVHGHLVVERCPADWKKDLPIWGARRGDWSIVREVKRQLDPGNLFNPGRFVEGI